MHQELLKISNKNQNVQVRFSSLQECDLDNCEVGNVQDIALKDTQN
jgi:hypothetical protein